MSKRYSLDDDIYTCLECDDFVGKRSGYYKHRNTKHSHGGEVDNTPSSSVSAADTSTDEGSPSPAPTQSEDDASFPEDDDTFDDNVGQEDEEMEDNGMVDDSSWMTWESEVEDTTTHSMPTPLKAMKKKSTKGKRSKKTAKELQSARETSKNLVVMGLGMSDTVMSAYGRGVTLDKDFRVEHSKADKELVAEAQVAYMEEKGIFLSDRISKGMVAGAMLVWYHGVPLNDIRKKSKVKMFKRTTGVLSRLPILGRLFRGRKKKAKQTTLPVEDEEVGVYGL